MKIEAGKLAIENGVFNTIVAKEICAGKFVSSANKGRERLNRFTQSVGIPDVEIGGGATARFDEEYPELGCLLTKLPSDAE